MKFLIRFFLPFAALLLLASCKKDSMPDIRGNYTFMGISVKGTQQEVWAIGKPDSLIIMHYYDYAAGEYAGDLTISDSGFELYQWYYKAESTKRMVFTQAGYPDREETSPCGGELFPANPTLNYTWKGKDSLTLSGYFIPVVIAGFLPYEPNLYNVECKLSGDLLTLTERYRYFREQGAYHRYTADMVFTIRFKRK